MGAYVTGVNGGRRGNGNQMIYYQYNEHCTNTKYEHYNILQLSVVHEKNTAEIAT